MPPKAAPDDISRDAVFIFQCLMNSETKPKINWVKVAAAMKLKNARTASTRFYQIAKKHGLDVKWNATAADASSGAATDTTGSRAGTTPKTKSTKRQRGKNVEVDEDEDDEEPVAEKKPKIKAEEKTEALETAKFDSGVSFTKEGPRPVQGFTPINGGTSGVKKREERSVHQDDEEDKEISVKVEPLAW